MVFGPIPVLGAAEDKLGGLFSPGSSEKPYKLGKRESRQADYAEASGKAGAQRSMEVRGRQGELADMLEARARGEGGPSVAEQQMKRGRDEAIKAQMGIAAGARGPNIALAGRNAATAGADISAKTGAAAAELRAQEQMGAEERLAQALAAQREQDLGQRAQDLGQSSDIRDAKVGMAKARSGVAAANAQARASLGGGLAQAAGAVLPLIAGTGGSDEGLKEGARSGTADVRTLLEALGRSAGATFEEIEPQVFRYTPTAAQNMGTDTDERLGVMAQDVEKAGPVGDAMEVDTPSGKGLAPMESLGAVLAAMADTAQRVGRLEELLAAKAG
jgi:hypothetical protein